MKLNQFRRFFGERAADPHTNKGTQRHRPANRYSFVIIVWSCIAILGGSSATAADPHATGWIELCPPISPPPRSYLAMTYDPASGKVIMFGGFDLFGGFDGRFYQGTMWQWNGSDWNQLFPATLPYARSSAAVGVNNSTGEVVMFGGLADVNPFNTWTYDGTTWTLQSPLTQPTLVYGGSAAFDPHLNAVVLFGGGSGGVDQNSTWAWRRSNWKQLLTMQSPPAREGAGIAYDPAS